MKACDNNVLKEKETQQSIACDLHLFVYTSGLNTFMKIINLRCNSQKQHWDKTNAFCAMYLHMYIYHFLLLLRTMPVLENTYPFFK